jgi:ribose 5-phosphate isomerase
LTIVSTSDGVAITTASHIPTNSPTISDPSKLEELILSVDGVVEVGLFVGMCDAVVMATPSEVLTIVKEDGRLD